MRGHIWHIGYRTISIGRGSPCRRLLYWPGHGVVALRFWKSWWLGLHWPVGG